VQISVEILGASYTLEVGEKVAGYGASNGDVEFGLWLVLTACSVVMGIHSVSR
jgi:hypothetical protein